MVVMIVKEKEPVFIVRDPKSTDVPSSSDDYGTQVIVIDPENGIVGIKNHIVSEVDESSGWRLIERIEDESADIDGYAKIFGNDLVYTDLHVSIQTAIDIVKLEINMTDFMEEKLIRAGCTNDEIEWVKMLAAVIAPE